MEYKFLGDNFDFKTIKSMSSKDREVLCSELRDKIINTVSQNGGHLASNLGVVELTVALLSVFDVEKDKIVFDVGHQSYSYKLLTGRFKDFGTLRQKGGISGFPRISESKYDAFDTGHSSTSISAAVGMARARDLKGDDNYVVSIIGDGALTGGLAYEAINDIGHRKSKMIVILNDNEMSIDPNVGGLSKHLSNIRISSGYISAKKSAESTLNKIPLIGKLLIKLIVAIKDFFRFLLYRKSPSIFEDLGMVYYGPIDGHDTNALIKALDAVKDINTPVLLHIVTKKGKGYSFAERNPSNYHGVSPFDVNEGVKTGASRSYTAAFAGALSEISQKNNKVVAISAAMAQGTGLENYSLKYPSRFFDCGIAEEHCVTMAAGMSVSGFTPVVAIYSSFLQRAYDEMIHDVCFMNNHVVFAIDRAGFVGNDGHTHHGLIDMSYLNSMPNMTAFAARDYKDLRNILDYCINKHNGPCAVRYPRGASPFEENGPLYQNPDDCVKPHLSESYGNQFAIISIGKMADEATKALTMLKDKGINGTHINLSIIKPIPTTDIIEMLNGITKIFTLEEGILSGGIGESIENELEAVSKDIDVEVIAVTDVLVKADSQKGQLKTAGIDAESVYKRIISNL